MSKPAASGHARQAMVTLSRLLLSPDESDASLPPPDVVLRNIDQEEFNGLVALAHSNHVIVRALEVFRAAMLAYDDSMRSDWASAAMAVERSRIATSIGFLRLICDAFDEEGLDVTVMKSLDHWPDLGSDLDLYSNAPSRAICALMQRRFGARILPQSWGDRLACKQNFQLPGLFEPVEVHMGRLGQTGEQLALGSGLPQRSRPMEVDGHIFRVPSASDRLMVSTLQRMYRHFYFRLCDIVDSATLATSGDLDYEDLRFSARKFGIWEGTATYLVIVSDYVQQYGGADIRLPTFVTDAARFRGDIVYFGKQFLRVPILPQSVGLYRSQLAGLLRKQELHSSARLGLLPGLAIIAAVSQRITGSDKGIW